MVVWGLTWVLCLIALISVVDENRLTFRSGPESIQDIIEFTAQPGVIILGLYYCIMYLLKGNRELTYPEDAITSWFIHNGGIIHLAMEGLAGGWHMWREIEHPYRIIDNRFNYDILEADGGPTKDAALGVLIITQLELFVWFPFCMATAIAFTTGSRHRYLLAIVTSVMQIIGTVFFVVPPIMGNCLDLPTFNEPGCFPKLDRFTFIFIYIAFGANFLWFVIPSLIAVYSWKRETERFSELRKID